MEHDNKAVGRRIKQLRVSNGDTLESFGQRFSTSKVTVYNWEVGRNLPNKANLKAIAELGSISVNELLYGSVEERVYSAIHENKRNEGLSNEVIESIAKNILDSMNKRYPDNSIIEDDLHSIVNAELILKSDELQQTEKSFINNKITLINDFDKEYVNIESQIDETIASIESGEDDRYSGSSLVSQLSQELERMEEAKIELQSNPKFKFYVHNSIIYLIVNKNELTVDDVEFNAGQYDNLIVKRNGKEIEHITDLDNAILIDAIKKYHDWNTSIILTVNAWFKMLDLTQHI